MHQSYLQKYNFLRKSHHSIPIGLCVGVVALLLGGAGIGFGGEKVGALTCPPIGAVKPDSGNTTVPEGYTTESGDIETCSFLPILTEPETVTPTLTLSIDGKTEASDRVVAGYNKVNYSSHTVAVKAEHIENYTMVLSEVTMSGPSTLTGVSNVAGSELGENAWGYAWGEATVADEKMTYGSDVSKNLAGDNVSGGGVDFSRKLVFATKFNEEAESGNYHVSAKLSAVATPQAVLTYVPWDKLVYMQDMNTTACTEAPMGVSKTLKDIRDDSVYTVAKLSDGKCWMTQNLRLTGDSIAAKSATAANKILGLTYFDSDVSEEYDNNRGPFSGLYEVPESSEEGFSDNAAANIYYGGDTDYGAYYSWCAATAGSCKDVAEDGANATYSVCPKGWRLPTGDEYSTLLNNWPEAALGVVSGKNGRWFGAADAAGGGTFFPVPGYYHDNTVKDIEYSGNYWSSTVDNWSKKKVFDLGFSLSSVTPGFSSALYVGISMRCVAR